eukprot:gene40786-65561_t
MTRAAPPPAARRRWWLGVVPTQNEEARLPACIRAVAAAAAGCRGGAHGLGGMRWRHRGATTAALAAAAGAAPPNVLWIHADDRLGYGDLAVFGHPTSLTPHIDRLAAEGTRFTQCRAGLLTGRLPARACASPEHTGRGGPCCNGVFLPAALDTSEEVTVAAALRGAGYVTGAPTWTPCAVYANRSIVEQPVEMRTLSERYVAAAAAFIHRAAAASRPFFYYFASHHVHSPQFAGEGATNATLRGRFGDSLNELDHSVGALVDAVDGAGLRGSTF